MRNEYRSRQSPNLQSINDNAQNKSERVAQSSENDLLIRDSLKFCETLCEEFNRRWNRNERFYRSKQRRAARLFIIEELAVASDSERTVSRRYPEHLQSTLKAIAELTSACGALHTLSPDSAVVIGSPPNQQCVPVKEAIMRFLREPNPEGKTAPGATPAKAA
jgi:hypothetical protein